LFLGYRASGDDALRLWSHEAGQADTHGSGTISFYIVEIISQFDWNRIQERLLSIAQGFADEVNFIMSPVYHEETDYFVFHIPDDNFYRQA
jgi:hypothetical protein